MKDLLLFNIDVIKQDLFLLTGIYVSTLKVEKENNFTYKLTSNYLDNDLGIFSNNFKKSRVVLRAAKENNFIFISGQIFYENIMGGLNSIPIIQSKENSRYLRIEYVIDKDTNKLMYLKPKYNNDTIKIIIKHYDEQLDTHRIFTIPKLQDYDLKELLRTDNEKVESISILKYDGVDFVEFDVPKNLKRILKNAFNQNEVDF